MDLEAEIAALRAEVETLKAGLSEARSSDPGGFGPDMGLPLTPLGGEQGAFRWEGDKITHCNFQFGREVHSIGYVQASGDGTYWLKVPHDTPARASVVTTQETSDLTKTVIPLFRVEDGEIAEDYRGMPVIPVRE